MQGNGDDSVVQCLLESVKFMRKSGLCGIAMLGLSVGWVSGQNLLLSESYEPQPRVVTPASCDCPVAPPSDAVVLFDGTDLSAWVHADGTPADWEVAEGVLTVKPQSGSIQTKADFEDFQLHIEWSSPVEVKGEDQLRGNSGVILQGRYEVQILDSYDNPTYVNGQAGSIYKQYPPLVNAMQKPGEWNTFDIIFTAPRFKADGSLHSPAYLTVLHNGVLVQNHSAVLGITNLPLPEYKAHGRGPIVLQDHGDLVRFRNIWIREL